MHCVGLDVVLVGYETTASSIIMIVLFDNTEAYFQSFEPSFSHIAASPIAINIINTIPLKAGSVVNISANVFFEQRVSDFSNMIIQMSSVFLNDVTSIEFNGISKTFSQDSTTVSFLIESSFSSLVNMSMIFNNVTIPRESRKIAFASGYILNTDGLKTHELVMAALSISVNEFVETKATCFPSCFAGESPPARIDILTANDLQDGDFLRVMLLEPVRIAFQQSWTAEHSVASLHLQNSSAFDVTLTFPGIL
jgi:hypothetical protein